MATFAQGGLSAWMPTYFHRYFDMGVARAGLVFGVMVVVCGAAGTYLGGRAADRLLPKTSKAYFITIFASLLCMLPFAWMGVHAQREWMALAMFSLAVVCIFLPMGPIAAALVALTRPQVRSMAFAVNIFIIHALGDAVSPMLIGHASDLWGLKTAVLLCTLSALPACLFTAAAAKTAPNAPAQKASV